ncbi:MAG TPA: HNH endonuclease family protein [Candidatus Kapabacteria bacterium]|nr:HNH endonuclease family protein [Candidatus Kapabacteria bacterium]
MEKAYEKAAKEISDKKVNTARDVFSLLKGVYVSDENYINAFSTREINSKRKRKLVRYILFNLENQIAVKDYSYEDGKATIEHILPENSGHSWDNFFPSEDQENFIYRLGNYTLLEDKPNRINGTCLYEKKVSDYKNSGYKLTSEKSIYPEWNADSLLNRQKSLARIASTVWKCNY